MGLKLGLSHKGRMTGGGCRGRYLDPGERK